jgi:serine/threonine-protein kinase
MRHMTAATPDTLVGAQPDFVGRFKIDRLIGVGSMGAVYLADDPVINRQVAIKTINVGLPKQQARLYEDSFLNEARAAGRLNHPYIVTVYDAGRIDGMSYIAMEYLKGHELKELIARGEEFTMRQFAEIFIRVADALEYAHEHGVVHRDVKPANIFLTSKTQPKVLDFGIAQAATSVGGSMLAGVGNPGLVGTPNYMPPELINGKPLDGRADIFSLGVVMYEVLTGQVPFRGKTFEELTNNIVFTHPQPPQELNPEVPLAISRIVAQALAKSPSDRYQNARALADDLRRYVASVRVKQLMSVTQPMGVNNTTQVPARIGTAALGGAAALLLIAAALASYAIWWRDAPPPAPVVAEAPAPVGTLKTEAQAPESASAPTSARPDSVRPSVPVQSVPRADRVKRETRKPASSTAASPTQVSNLGTVAIAVSPWGEVFINGTPRGISPPVSSITLSPGHYTIEIRNGDSEPYRATIEVKADDTTHIRHRFR